MDESADTAESGGDADVGMSDTELEFDLGPTLDALRAEHLEPDDDPILQSKTRADSNEYERRDEEESAYIYETPKDTITSLASNDSFPIDLVQAKVRFAKHQSEDDTNINNNNQAILENGGADTLSRRHGVVSSTQSQPQSRTFSIRRGAAKPQAQSTTARGRRTTKSTLLDRRDIVDEAARFAANKTLHAAKYHAFRSAAFENTTTVTADAMFRALYEEGNGYFAGKNDQNNNDATLDAKTIDPRPGTLQNLAAAYEHVDRNFRGFCVDDSAPQRPSAVQFCRACVTGDVAAVQAALEATRGTNRARLVNWKNRIGQTPVHRLAALARNALKPAHETIMDILFRAGASADERDCTGWTPLFYAVQNDHRAIIAILCDYGASLRVRDDPATLQQEVNNIQSEVAELCKLLDMANLAAEKDKQPRSIFKYCRDLGRPATLKFLVDISAIRIESPTRRFAGFAPLFREDSESDGHDAKEDDELELFERDNVPHDEQPETVLIEWTSAARTWDFDVYFHVVHTVSDMRDHDPEVNLKSGPSQVREAVQLATELMRSRIWALNRFQIAPGYDIDAKRDLFDVLEDSIVEDEEALSRRSSLRISRDFSMSRTFSGSSSQGPASPEGLSSPMTSTRFGLELIGRAVSSRTIGSDHGSSTVPSSYTLHVGRVEGATKLRWTMPPNLRDTIAPDSLAIFEVRHCKNDDIAGYSEVFPVFMS
ncbi:Ankyrin repeat domain-containing protein 17 [Hondaea fermentalgiana]|uniref:Ankyrin repeat domain-containing protein 17 n=1 Tax=Hondaea fermentalgiana TaxID=2315210 RepID=A0A2R5GD23_9STRA|nr:Ankyrin repeat domain-containing protein 17 [Hondaea fermentalgiana]|eukprot:GBG27608.1 Ankyrin repeat domain-containing protein 17 [Hondaea fermentalgiana]